MDCALESKEVLHCLEGIDPEYKELESLSIFWKTQEVCICSIGTL